MVPGPEPFRVYRRFSQRGAARNRRDKQMIMCALVNFGAALSAPRHSMGLVGLWVVYGYI